MASQEQLLDVKHDWRVRRFMNWLCTPPKDREPRHKKDLAEELGVIHKTLNNWQNHPEFLKEWERLYLKTIGDPGVKLRIMKTLEATATDRDDPKHVQAAKTYMEIEGSMKPQKVEVQVSKDPEKLTDEELDAYLSAAARSEVERREGERERQR